MISPRPTGTIPLSIRYAGESAGLIDAVEPAAEIVARAAQQAEDLLRRAGPA